MLYHWQACKQWRHGDMRGIVAARKNSDAARMSRQKTGLEALRILVIEDHKGMREIISTILTGLGVGQIDAVADLDTALRLLRNAPPDIILLDWMLDRQDGLRFVRFVRRLPDALNPFVPIIMVTGHADRAHVTEARDAGVTEFVVKPLSTLAVARRLEMVIHNPRPFIRAKDYTGPDRRRQERPIDGPERRGEVPLDPAATTVAEEGDAE